MMRTQDIIIMSSMVMLIAIQTSCRSRMVNSARIRNSEKMRESVNLKSKQNESLASSRVIFMSDSTVNAYRVTIFPVDTFTYSPEAGFKGKARKIEASGIARELKKTGDSSATHFQKELQVDYRNSRDTRKVEGSRAKVMEKERVGLVSTLFVVILAVLIISLWYKLR